jgi:hypothetical protein
LQVKETRYSLSVVNGSPRFEVNYLIDMRNNPTRYQMVQENFLLSTEKAVRFFYHTIAKLHFMHPHQAFSRLQNIQFLKSIIENGELYSPKSIECVEMDGNRLKVVEKHFDHPIMEQDLRQLDVLHTFFDFNEIKNTITFEYLIRENETFSLIRDNYRLKTPTSAKRFAKNYGSAIGSDIKTIADNQRDILTPSKIWVDVNNRMQRFVEDSPKVTNDQRFNFICPRVELNISYEKWCEIIKIEIFNNEISYDKNDKFFKVFRAQIYAYGTFQNCYGEKYDRIIRVSCKIAESDLDRIQSKQYKYLMPIADGRHAEDVEQWKTMDDKVFLKHNCVNHRERAYY